METPAKPATESPTQCPKCPGLLRFWLKLPDRNGALVLVYRCGQCSGLVWDD